MIVREKILWLSLTIRGCYCYQSQKALTVMAWSNMCFLWPWYSTRMDEISLTTLTSRYGGFSKRVKKDDSANPSFQCCAFPSLLRIAAPRQPGMSWSAAQLIPNFSSTLFDPSRLCFSETGQLGWLPRWTVLRGSRFCAGTRVWWQRMSPSTGRRSSPSTSPHIGARPAGSSPLSSLSSIV